MFISQVQGTSNGRACIGKGCEVVHEHIAGEECLDCGEPHHGDESDFVVGQTPDLCRVEAWRSLHTILLLVLQAFDAFVDERGTLELFCSGRTGGVEDWRC